MVVRKFIVAYLLYTLLVAGLFMGIKYLFPQAVTKQFWLIFSFLNILTLIAYFLAYIGIKKNPQTGVLSILGSVILKMLFAMSFVLIYSLKQTKGDLAFALNFFSLYLLFTLFEIISLLRNLRHQNK